MKTQEELSALKIEAETPNRKLAELSKEELAQVTGGSTLPPGMKPIGQTRQIGDSLFSGHVDKYSAIQGHTYYIVCDDRDEWYMGRLVRSFEANWIVCTVRTHIFEVVIHNGNLIATETIQFSGDAVTLYNSRHDV